jgi:hypothetical protein
MRTNLFLLLPLVVGLTACGNKAANQDANENPEGSQAEPNSQQASQPAARERTKAPGAKKGEKALQSRERASSSESPRAEETSRAVPQPTVTDIPAGATVSVRIDQPLDTAQNKAGDTFAATLNEAVVVDGRVAIPKGTRFTGSVTAADASGRLQGQATLTLTLDSFVLKGQNYRISTAAVSRASGGHKKRDIGLIGGGTGLGAAIGAIAGGGKGAAIGAAAGAVAGTAGAAATGKQQVAIPAETVMVFTLQSPLRVRS